MDYIFLSGRAGRSFYFDRSKGCLLYTSCIDFLESKMKAQVENRFGKKSEMTDLGKDYIRMQMSVQSTWQMKVLALNDSTNVICTAVSYTHLDVYKRQMHNLMLNKVWRM